MEYYFWLKIKELILKLKLEFNFIQIQTLDLNLKLNSSLNLRFKFNLIFCWISDQKKANFFTENLNLTSIWRFISTSQTHLDWELFLGYVSGSCLPKVPLKFPVWANVMSCISVCAVHNNISSWTNCLRKRRDCLVEVISGWIFKFHALMAWARSVYVKKSALRLVNEGALKAPWSRQMWLRLILWTSRMFIQT